MPDGLAIVKRFDRIAAADDAAFLDPRPLTAGSPRTRRDSCARRPRGRPATLRFAAPAPTSELSYQGLPNNQIKFESARGVGSGFPLIGAGARSLCWVMVATLRCDKFNTK